MSSIRVKLMKVIKPKSAAANSAADLSTNGDAEMEMLKWRC
jgi:hypothetical protein